MRDCGLRLAAITDHDTLAATASLRRCGLGTTATRGGPAADPGTRDQQRRRRELMAMGVELEEGELHILGFGVDPDDPAFEQRARATARRPQAAHPLMIDAAARAGLPVDEQIAPALASEEAIGRPHVARALVAGRPRGRPSRTPSTVSSTATGPPTCRARAWFTRQAIDAIRAAGGIAGPGALAGRARPARR